MDPARARRGHADRPVKQVCFTGEDRAQVAGLLELTARLQGLKVPALLERYVREALRTDPIAIGLLRLVQPPQERK